MQTYDYAPPRVGVVTGTAARPKPKGIVERARAAKKKAPPKK